MRVRKAFATVAAVGMLIGGGVATAQVNHGANPSDPNGASANPNGKGVNSGGGIHGIDAGAPGQSGPHPSERETPPACTMHNGMTDGTNKNCN